MPNQYINNYGNSKSANFIIGHTIALISMYGYDHVTLPLICFTTKCSKSTIMSKFGGLKNVLQVSLIACLDDLVDNLKRQLKTNDTLITSLMDIWHQINIYNFNHTHEANVLIQYLRNPGVVAIPDLKMRLNALLKQAFDKTEKNLTEKSNPEIRFLAFMSLCQSANYFTQKVCKSSGFTDIKENEYYDKHIAPEIEKILALPVY